MKVINKITIPNQTIEEAYHRMSLCPIPELEGWKLGLRLTSVFDCWSPLGGAIPIKYEVLACWNEFDLSTAKEEDLIVFCIEQANHSIPHLEEISTGTYMQVGINKVMDHVLAWLSSEVD